MQMDNLFEIIGWLIVIFFFLFGGRKNKKKQRPPLPQDDAAPAQQQPQTLEEALREIREALSEKPRPEPRKETTVQAPARPTPRPTPRPKPRPAPPPPVRASKPGKKKTRRDTEFVSPIDDPRPAESDIALRERSFSGQPVFKGDQFLNLEQADVRGARHPHRGGVVRSAPSASSDADDFGGRRRPVHRLDAKELRRAVVMREILDRPRAYRPYGRDRD